MVITWSAVSPGTGVRGAKLRENNLWVAQKYDVIHTQQMWSAADVPEYAEYTILSLFYWLGNCTESNVKSWCG